MMDLPAFTGFVLMHSAMGVKKNGLSFVPIVTLLPPLWHLLNPAVKDRQERELSSL
jgi:hypothetical protein